MNNNALKPICSVCWYETFLDKPVRNRQGKREQCAVCGILTSSGIYTDRPLPPPRYLAVPK